MSAATESATFAPATQPEVTQSTGVVEPPTTETTAAPVAEAAPTTTEATKAADIPVTTDGATVEAPPSDEKNLSKKETQITATPITSGVLGYKAPGILR